MKVECLVEHIEKVLPSLSKITPSYSQAPILSNILVEATKDGLFLSSTDLEIGARLHVSAKVVEEGATTISGRHFTEVIHSLPKTKITLTLDKDILKLTSDDNTIFFNTISKEEFPHLFDQKGEKILTLTGDEFRSIFLKLLFATSQDEARPQLTGVLFASQDYGIDFVATDGFRLAVTKTKEKNITEGMRLIVSSRLLQEALSLKDNKSAIDIYFDAGTNQVLFETEGAIMVGRTIQGDFPSYERVIPTSSQTTIVVDKEELLDSLKLAFVFAKESSQVVKLECVEKTLIIRASSAGIGEGKMTLSVDKEGENVEVSFNARYMMDFLRNSEGKSVVMKFNSSVEPGLFMVEKNESYLYVIMPVRVQE